MFKRVIILLIFITISFVCNAQNTDRYSLGNPSKGKSHFHLSLKHLFKKDPQKKADKKKEKEDIKARKQQTKDAKTYQKKNNSEKSVSTRKPVYESMEKNKKLSKKVNENKHNDPWIVRIFKHKHNK